MEIIGQFIDIVLHLDVHLASLLATYGAWVYVVLFLIVFCETGLVVTPLLPGDSLLFVAGALAATSGADSGYNIQTLVVVLLSAAVLGDNVNYAIGRWAGRRILRWGEGSRWFNRAAFDRTHAFYERYGGITMLVARFMPFVRTFAPFVAGVAEMHYAKYFAWDFAGAVLWVGSMCLGGYLFGNVPWVKANLSLIFVATIAFSVVPLGVVWLREHWKARSAT